MLKQKEKKYISTIIIIALAFVMLIFIVPATRAYAGTNGKTQDQAITWVKSKLGQTVGSGECVALIQAYYQYLGQATPYGHGADYASPGSNRCPSGWRQLQGVQPQKGDILVYKASTENKYGHVAIYESDYSTYHQNFNSRRYVQRVADIRYDGFYNEYWGVIRPDWNAASSSSGSSTSGARGSMTTPTITTDRYCYSLNETAKLSWPATSANTDFYQYWVIVKNTTTGKQIYAAASSAKSGDVSSNHLNVKLTSAGRYCLTVYAVPYHDKDNRQKVATKYITCGQYGEMTTPTITTDKSEYTVNDTAKLTWPATSENTDFYQYWVIVKNTTTGKQIYAAASSAKSGDVGSNFLNVKLSDSGSYKITVYAVPYFNKDTRQKVSTKTVQVSSASVGTQVSLDWSWQADRTGVDPINGIITMEVRSATAGTWSNPRFAWHRVGHPEEYREITADISGSSTNKTLSCNFSTAGITLDPDTKYQYVFKITYNGKQYDGGQSPGVQYFTTGSESVKVTWGTGKQNISNDTNQTLSVTIPVDSNVSGTWSNPRFAWHRVGHSDEYREMDAVISNTGTHADLSFDFSKNGISLDQETDYQLVFKVTFNGKQYTSNVKGFTTEKYLSQDTGRKSDEEKTDSNQSGDNNQSQNTGQSSRDNTGAGTEGTDLSYEKNTGKSNRSSENSNSDNNEASTTSKNNNSGSKESSAISENNNSGSNEVSDTSDGNSSITNPSYNNYDDKVKAPKIRLLSVRNTGKRAMTVRWDWNVKADGYQIQYATRKSFGGAKTKKGGMFADTLKIAKLKKKTYYVRVRSFVKDSYGDKVYGKWSNVKKIKIRK